MCGFVASSQADEAAAQDGAPLVDAPRFAKTAILVEVVHK